VTRGRPPWQAVHVSRDPETIQREIEQARAELGSTLDQLVVRTSPKTLAAKGKQSAQEFLVSTRGRIIVGGSAAAVVALIVVNRLRLRHR